MLLSLAADLSIKPSAKPPFAAGAAPVYAFLAVVCAMMPLAIAKSGLQLASDQFLTAGGMFALPLWIACCLRGRGLARMATALEGCFLFFMTSMVVCLMTFVAATVDRPFIDAPLAMADRILLPGFDWPSAMLAFSRSGEPVWIANVVYQSIAWQPQILIVSLALMSAHERVWHFLTAWIATLCFVIVVFVLCPSQGAYQHFGIAASDVPAMLDPTPWNQPLLLDGLRSGTLGLISLGTLDGIVNYPSFHAAAALLLAHAFWQVRVLRWPAMTLNIVMFATAVPIGGHYVVDLIAGAVTALAGIKVATFIMSRVGRTPSALAESVSLRNSTC